MSDEETVRCGNCGGDTAKIDAVRFGDGGVGFSKLILTCTSCAERSIIQVRPTRLEIEWGEGSNGVFCVGWSD